MNNPYLNDLLQGLEERRIRVRVTTHGGTKAVGYVTYLSEPWFGLSFYKDSSPRYFKRDSIKTIETTAKNRRTGKPQVYYQYSPLPVAADGSLDLVRAVSSYLAGAC